MHLATTAGREIRHYSGTGEGRQGYVMRVSRHSLFGIWGSLAAQTVLLSCRNQTSFGSEQHEKVGNTTEDAVGLAERSRSKSYRGRVGHNAL